MPVFCKAINLIKKNVMRIAGIVVFKLCPDIRDRLLQYWSNTKDLKSYKRFLFDAVYSKLNREYYDNKTTSARREELKKMCMSGYGGVEWAVHYASVPFPDKETESVAMWGWMEELLKSGRIKKVHQVAASSGREILYFARRFPNIEFVGSDFDINIIDACKKRYENVKNLSFEVLDISHLDSINIKTLSADLIFDSCGLQYLDEKSLKDFLQKSCAVTHYLLLQETLAVDFLMDRHEYSLARGGFCWNHPYTKYVKEMGWEDVEYKVYFEEEHYWAKTLSIKANRGV